MGKYFCVQHGYRVLKFLAVGVKAIDSNLCEMTLNQFISYKKERGKILQIELRNKRE